MYPFDPEVFEAIENTSLNCVSTYSNQVSFIFSNGVTLTCEFSVEILQSNGSCSKWSQNDGWDSGSFSLILENDVKSQVVSSDVAEITLSNDSMIRIYNSSNYESLHFYPADRHF